MSVAGFSFIRCIFFILSCTGRFWLLAKFTGWVSGVLSRADKSRADPRLLMREDFRLLLRESEAAGIIDTEGADLLDKSLDFYTVKVGDIMVPRKRIREIAAHTTVAEAMQFCKDHGISRLPVFLENTRQGHVRRDRWIGVFSVYDAIFNIPEKNWEERQGDDLPAAADFYRRHRRGSATCCPRAKTSRCPLIAGGFRQPGGFPSDRDYHPH